MIPVGSIASLKETNNTVVIPIASTMLVAVVSNHDLYLSQ